MPIEKGKKKKKRKDYIELITRVTKRFLTQFDRDYVTSVELFSKILDKRDSYTHDHSKNVSKYAMAIAEALELPSKEKDIVKYAALLHDIGKMGIDMSILQKKGKLTAEEWKEIKIHTKIGSEIVAKIKSLADIIPAVLHHHERFGGGGYPYPELKDTDIPLTARIIACADAYDAMRSDRTYRKALSEEVAIKELSRCAGTQFDPHVVDVFLGVINGQ